MDIWKELQDEGVDAGLLEEIRRFRAAHPLTEADHISIHCRD